MSLVIGLIFAPKILMCSVWFTNNFEWIHAPIVDFELKGSIEFSALCQIACGKLRFIY